MRVVVTTPEVETRPGFYLSEKWVAQSTESIPNKTLLETQEAGPTHQDELTQFREAEHEVTVQSAADSQFMHDPIDNPFPTQVPTSILSRNYRVFTFNWGPSYTTQVLDFPYCLLQQETIQDALASFYYFRGDVKMEVRINTTPFHYGALQVSWLPFCVTSASINPYYASGNRPVIISASTQQAATISMPWTAPTTWVNWLNASTLDAVEATTIGRVYFHQLVPLTTTSTSITDTVVVQVFASFENPRVAGYLPSSSTRLRMKDRTKTKSKPMWQQSGKDRFRTPTSQEAVAKSSSQTLVSSTIDSTLSPIIKTIGTFGDSIASAATGLFSGGKFLGLFDKPRSLQSTQPVMFDFSKGHAQVDGLLEAQTLGMYQSNKLGSSSNMMGGESSDMPLSALAGVPMLHRIIPFTAANQVDSQTVIDPVYYNNSYSQPDYFFFTAQMFSYWRGSIKYMIQFITTAFTTARFRISVNYVSYSSAVTTTGDVVSRIVDVKGDTITEFTVPYLYQSHWRQVNGHGTISDYLQPRLSIEVLEDIIGQSLESDPTVYVLIWRAAGEDIQFQQLNPPSFLMWAHRKLVYAIASESHSGVSYKVLLAELNTTSSVLSHLKRLKTF